MLREVDMTVISDSLCSQLFSDADSSIVSRLLVFVQLYIQALKKKSSLRIMHDDFIKTDQDIQLSFSYFLPSPQLKYKELYGNLRNYIFIILMSFSSPIHLSIHPSFCP